MNPDRGAPVGSAVPSCLLVLGAGTMGSQIAQQAGLHGVEVRLVDHDGAQLQRAVDQNRRLLERRAARGVLSVAEVEQALGRVETSRDLGAAAVGCDWAIEAVTEDAAAKRRAFADLDAALPIGAGIATNSSNIVVSRIADATGRPELCCNMHFFHPVLLMDLCEVAGSPATATATMARAQDWAVRMGRRPVLVHGEVDGLIVNRVLGAASAEAFALLADGVASVTAIDTAARAGLNWKMGPFELADFSGLDVVLGVRRDRFQRLGAAQDGATVDLLERLVAAGRLGRKNGRGFYDYSTQPPTPLPLPDRG